MEIDERVPAAKFAVLLPHLDERQRLVALGAEARWLGHGGIELVARASGVSRKTVFAGAAELEAGDDPPGERVRREGRGPQAARLSLNLGLAEALDGLVEPGDAGGSDDPPAVDYPVDP